LSHYVKVDIPINCTVEQFETILEENHLTFENTIWKNERIEKDLVKIRGKSVTIASDNNHVVCAYHYNIPDAVKKTKDKS
jgi:hypothetical protein|tara:strand:- start:943 stop:1182 length:240 start_codon:yes stop_codon:yes gene_type:complete